MKAYVAYHSFFAVISHVKKQGILIILDFGGNPQTVNDRLGLLASIYCTRGTIFNAPLLTYLK